MHATEGAGFLPTGEFRQLNSYENRVFDIKLENETSIVAKFYRPNRWSNDCILEEHAFLFELVENGFPALPPLKLQKQGKANSLLLFEDHRVAFFPKKQARMPDELLPADIPLVARKIAELHRIGSLQKFRERPHYLENLAENLELNLQFVSPDLRQRYAQVSQDLEELVLEHIQDLPMQRIHGDLHRGNLLFDGKEFFFIDFDDCLWGPKFQDIWMLWIALEPDFRDLFADSYDQFNHFPFEQLELMDLFQGFRILNSSAWIARRWEDPSFPALFPNFGSYNYWAEETEALEKCVRSFQRRS